MGRSIGRRPGTTTPPALLLWTSRRDASVPDSSKRSTVDLCSRASFPGAWARAAGRACVQRRAGIVWAAPRRPPAGGALGFAYAQPMSAARDARPIMLVVEDESEVRARIRGELERRYGSDYRVTCEGSALAALAKLERWRASAEPVALVLV